MPVVQKITPCLWFDDQTERVECVEQSGFYCRDDWYGLGLSHEPAVSSMNGQMRSEDQPRVSPIVGIDRMYRT